jgi:hypothetical protein
LDSIFPALQHALREHNERLRKLAAAKLTTGRQRNEQITITAPASRTLFECVICTQAIPLEDSKVSAEGQPMHEECYVGKVALRNRVPQQLQADP